MLQSLRLTIKADPEFASSVTALMESTARIMIGTIGGLYLLWACAYSIVRLPAADSWYPWSTALVIMLACPLALWLVTKNLIAAQLVCQVGLAVAIAGLIQVFQRPELAFFYGLLPLMAVVTIGWWAGVVVEGAVAALIWWLGQGPLTGLMPDFYVVAVSLAGLVSLILGWTVIHALFTVTNWSLFSLGHARKNVEGARQHRAQLLRLQKNLDQAYYQLDRANAALVAAWRDADEAERFKTEFVHNVSHELRTPLNLIVGFSEMIMTSPESYGRVELPRPYRGDMNSIYQSAQHLLALVDDILDLGRIEVGRVSLVRDEVDLAAVVTEAVEIVRDYIVAKGLALRLQIDPDLPRLWVDRLRVRQVLLNLLVNASRFTEKGQITVTVSQTETDIDIRVADTGRGIPAADLPHIFEEFHSRDETQSAWHSGTGLGLPISKKLVEMHQGHLGVESVYDQGTTFIVRLPKSNHVEAGAESASGGRTLPLVRVESPERIVVVAHDDPTVAPTLDRYFSNYHVIGAESVAAALKLADEVKAIAVVADQFSLAGASSTRITEAELANDCLLVNCPLPSGRRVAEALGTADFLMKPVSRRSLLAALDRLKRPIRRLLVVDDNPEVVALFERMLSQHPTLESCRHAFNGEEALDLMRAETPDAVILDLIMPDLDGHAVLDQIAADPQLVKVPVIVVSAETHNALYVTTGNPIRIAKMGEVQIGEVVRTLEGTFNALTTGWHPPAATVSGVGARPDASPVSVGRLLPPTSAPVEAR